MSKQYLCFYFVFFICLQLNAQFKFSGQVSEEFIGSSAYLVLIDDYRKSDLLLTDQIIQESSIDEYGYFNFSGDFLAKENRFYKIYVDQCNDDVSDFNHLLNHCDNSNSTIFIANNSDTIHFPINDLEQMFCSLEVSRPINRSIIKLDSIQEVLLNNLHDAKNDMQRKIIFNAYFKNLQSFSSTFNEPLVELYAYHMYANHQSITRDVYLEDVKHSNYYNALLNRLENAYPNTAYANHFKEDLTLDTYKKTNSERNLIIATLTILLAISVVTNYLLIKKRREKKSKIDYKTILSPQEQKVFDLMLDEIPNKEIADKLFISLSTVKTHINNIYTKLNISSRKEINQFR